MTLVWRKMQGVDTHQSCSEAEFLNLSINAHITWSYQTHEMTFLARYAVGGDVIETRSFGSIAELAEWIKEISVTEVAANISAILTAAEKAR